LEQAARSLTYRPNLRVFTIVVLTSGDKHKRDVSIIDFDPKDLKGQPLGEMAHKVFYLCPKYVDSETPPLIREWLEAVEDTFDEEVDETRYRATIQEVFKRIEKDKTTRQERAQMKEEAAQQLKEVEEYERGLLKGKAEGYAEIVARMAQKGMAAAEIATLTDLPLETVEQLLNESR
jgi:predicted transposase/invertase (TIGR01784 family)